MADNTHPDGIPAEQALEHIAANRERWQSLMESGEDAQMVEEIAEFFRLNLPPEHPLRTSDRVGFSTKPERIAKEQWEARKARMRDISHYSKRLLFTEDVDKMRARLYNIVVFLIDENHKEILDKLVQMGDNLNDVFLLANPPWMRDNPEQPS